MNKLIFPYFFIITITMMSCKSADDPVKEKEKAVRLITLHPGHFHAALVQKTMYDDVDSAVYLNAPEANNLKLHIDRINAYNTITESITHWKEVVYAGNYYFEKMITEKKNNVVVLAGNNQKKIEYILKSLEAGLNLHADKPMAITPGDFDGLKKVFEVTEEKDLSLYDITTERFEITTILHRELSMIPEIFGTLEKGTTEKPAIVMRGTKASLVIRQGNDESYKPVLYIEPATNDKAFQAALEQHCKKISTKFPGVELYKTVKGWSVKLPENMVEGHESYFARVTKNSLKI